MQASLANKRKIKVLFTTSNFETAGSGKVIYDLVRGLDKNKFDVSIACSHDRGDFFKTVEALGLPIYIIDTKTPYRPYYKLYGRIKRIRQFFERHDFDIVHSWQWSNDWTEAVAAKLAGAKWIYTKKAMGFGNKHWKIKSFIADFIITINDDMRAYFPYKKNQRLIPLGLDTHYYANQIDSDKALSQTFKIITVANLVPVKGVEVLIKAVGLLENKGISLTILGAHNNAYGADMKALVTQLGLEEQVDFISKKADVRPYISRCQLYVIPTLDEGRREGMPMALVEAMSMGLPVLGSRVSGIRYVLKDFEQLLFKPGSETALSEKIQMMMTMSEQDRQSLGNAMRQYCQEHFELGKFVFNHEALYEELVER